MKRKAVIPRDVPEATVTIQERKSPEIPVLPPPPPPPIPAYYPPTPPIQRPLEKAPLRVVEQYRAPMSAMLFTVPSPITGNVIQPNLTKTALGQDLYIPASGGSVPTLDVGTLNANFINGATGTFEYLRVIGPTGTYPNTSVSIDFKTARASNLLTALDDTGPSGPTTDLYFDGQLLAKADDIQDIADWALYPAIGMVDMVSNTLENVGTINQATGTANLQELVVLGNITQDIGKVALLPAVEANAIGTIATSAVDNLAFSNTDNIANFQYKFNGGNVAVDTLQTLTGTRPQMLNGVALNVGPTGAYGNLTTNTGGTGLFWNGNEISTGTGGNASNWSTFPAIANVDMTTKNITNIGNIGQGPTGTSTLGTVSILGNITQGTGGTSSFRNTTINNTLNLVDTVTSLPVPIQSVNNVLNYNGAPVGGGGAVDQWATFPAVADVVPTGTISVWNVGNLVSNTVLNGESVGINAESNILVMNDDQSILPSGSADINITSKGGFFGAIELLADKGYGGPLSQGGFINIQANSETSSILPTALSRVNVEAATISVSAGALGTLIPVPGSVNIVSGAGTGVQVLTTAGPINIASGTSVAIGAGTGVTLDGGVTGVTVNSGDLFVNKIQPNGDPNTKFTSAIATDGVIPFTNGSTGTTYVPNLALSSPNSTVTIGKTGTFPNQTITLEAIGGIGSATTIFVSPGGNDTTGTGSPTLPFATIGKALTVAATFADSIPVAINLYAGTYTETVTITRANTFINGLSAVAQECYINGSVTFAVNTSTLAFITGGMSGVRMNSLVCGGTPVVTTEYTFINCVVISASTVVPFTASQGGSVSYNVVLDGVTLSPTDTRCANVTSVFCSFLRCLLSVLTANTCLFIDGSGSVNVDNSQLSSSFAGPGFAPLIQFTNSATPITTSTISQSRLFFTSATTDTSTIKCCVRFLNSVTVSVQIDNCYFNCVGAQTGAPFNQCIQKPGTGAVNLTYGNIQAVSPAIWIAPAITRTILSSVQQGVNAVGVGAGDYLVWDGAQWATGGTTVSLGRGAGNAADVTCVNIGQNAGTSANTNGIAIGNGAGGTTTAAGTIAIGQLAGVQSGTNSICIGGSTQSGGANNIMIGANSGNGSGAGTTNCIILNATNTAVVPNLTSTCKIAPIRPAASTPATYSVSTVGSLVYNPASTGSGSYEVSYDTTSYKCSVIAAPTTLALNPTLRGCTFIVTGSLTLTITNTLAAGDAGFFVYLKNGTIASPADITLAGVLGATTLHQPSGSQNGQIVVLFWNGTTLTAY